ncbi:mycofactocin-associated electron transfer flavoprotein alpha subunit [Saccharopolyspora elongata]|uniref:Electron transfer flavoprotein subunit alpha/FixB family protein n=1 Tax=Saccharopolyspora elongata TaxID=2530387 RepID=A0A4R4Y472_9PSEU|nr:mycofactocin-associated electron transfer flavoprotein alpha subunit [Saccharopolyspora elongata]TDD39181.1 electron transfer flavoprotein subunit alpha/FixB family protein [Saccharopolyspora elongata]
MSQHKIAAIVVRDGTLPLGADEAVAEAGGTALVVGSGARAAAEGLSADRVVIAESSPAEMGGLAASIAPELDDHRIVVLPASPDGRDLAPRLAVELDRPLLAWATRCGDDEVELARLDDRVALRVAVDRPVVVTLAPNARSAEARRQRPRIEPRVVPERVRHDARLVETLPPDPSTMDLGEAPRIFAGGAGLVPPGESGTEAMRLLGEVARVLGASVGATRVVTDAGWLDYSRQIGTTGVVVDPRLYVAFGISGATQHTGGLGDPDCVVSINTDPSCPMTAMADLGIVADAPEVLRELARRLGVAEQSFAGGRHRAG